MGSPDMVKMSLSESVSAEGEANIPKGKEKHVPNSEPNVPDSPEIEVEPESICSK